jgi:ATP-dependent RNA helicase SUPV3L1/SUV3
LAEHLGSLPRRSVAAPLDRLTEQDRKILARRGVRLGLESVFLPDLLKPRIQATRALLWCLHRGREWIAAPPPGRVSLPATLPAAFYEAVGYRTLGPVALRLDMLERFAADLRKLARQGPLVPPAQWLSSLGVTAEDMLKVMEALGYAQKLEGDLLTFKPRRHKPVKAPRIRPIDEHSPFASLRGRLKQPPG